MQKKLTPLYACLAALSLAACAQFSAPSITNSPAARVALHNQTATLSLQLGWDRQAQAIRADVTFVRAMVLVNGKEPVVEAGALKDGAMDLSALPQGLGTVLVEAFDKDPAQGGVKIGEGRAGVSLTFGRRSYVKVTVLLDGQGKTSFLPLIPFDALKPTPSPPPNPTPTPSNSPDPIPSDDPSTAPSGSPAPSDDPSSAPSGNPSSAPSGNPSGAPSGNPSTAPTPSPTPYTPPSPLPTPSGYVPPTPLPTPTWDVIPDPGPTAPPVASDAGQVVDISFLTPYLPAYQVGEKRHSAMWSTSSKSGLHYIEVIDEVIYRDETKAVMRSTQLSNGLPFGTPLEATISFPLAMPPGELRHLGNEVRTLPNGSQVNTVKMLMMGYFYWFAPEIGVVRHEGAMDYNGDHIESIMQIKSFAK